MKTKCHTITTGMCFYVITHNFALDMKLSIVAIVWYNCKRFLCKWSSMFPFIILHLAVMSLRTLCIIWGPECQNILQEVGLLVGKGNSIIGSISSPSLYFGKFPIGKLYKSGTIQTFVYVVYKIRS